MQTPNPGTKPRNASGPITTIIVGFGASARIFHAPLIARNPAFALLGFVERHENKGQTAYPGTRTWRDLSSALADTHADLVVICTPNDTHVELAKTVLDAGANVVVEKPFTTYEQQARDLISYAQNAGKLLTVFQSRRLDGDYLTLRELLKKGLLGRIVSFESRYERWSPGIRPKPWKEAGAVGSTILDDLASHLIDQAVSLFGRPEAVYCRLSHQREGAKSDDAFSIDLYYPEQAQEPSPVRVSLHAGMMTRHFGPRFAISGDKGSYRVFGMDPQEDHLSKGVLPNAVGYGEYPFEKWGEIDFASVPDELPSRRSTPDTDNGRSLTFWDDGQRQISDVSALTKPVRVETIPGNYPFFYRNLAESILAGDARRLLVDPEESAFVIRVIEACRTSSTEKRVVSL